MRSVLYGPCRSSSTRRKHVVQNSPPPSARIRCPPDPNQTPRPKPIRTPQATRVAAMATSSSPPLTTLHSPFRSATASSAYMVVLARQRKLGTRYSRIRAVDLDQNTVRHAFAQLVQVTDSRGVWFFGGFRLWPYRWASSASPSG
jgi:hypothetical protein